MKRFKTFKKFSKVENEKEFSNIKESVESTTTQTLDTRDGKIVIYHIINSKTREILVSSVNKKKLEDVFTSEKFRNLSIDFIFSYDAEPIRNY